MGSGADRQEMEFEYLRRVRTARAAYEQFKLLHRRASDLANSVGEEAASTDGHLAAARSRNAYNAMTIAFDWYELELGRFCDLVLRQEVHEEEVHEEEAPEPEDQAPEIRRRSPARPRRR